MENRHHQTRTLEIRALHRGIYNTLLGACFFILFIAITIYLCSTANAQSTEDLVPDASVRESDSSIISPPTFGAVGGIYGVTEHSAPSMDVEIEPAPGYASLDYDMIVYRTVLSLQDTESRQGLAPGTLVNRYLAQVEEEKSKAPRMAEIIVNSADICHEGFEIWNQGSGICNQFDNHLACENNYDSCQRENANLKVIRDMCGGYESENARLRRMIEEYDSFLKRNSKRLWVRAGYITGRR